MPRAQYRKRHVPTYRSGLEETIGADVKSRGIGAVYEAAPITYTKPETRHRYTGDWFLRRDRGEVTYDFSSNPNWYADEAFWRDHFLVESKGMFSAEDRKKHLLIQAQYPSSDIRFVFSRSKSPLRKGAKSTYGEWCEKHGFIFADRLIPDDWFTE